MSDSLREAQDEIAMLRQELDGARIAAEQDTACEAEIIAKAHLQQAYAENARLRLELGRVIPFELGPSLVPAVEWLVAQVEARDGR